MLVVGDLLLISAYSTSAAENKQEDTIVSDKPSSPII